MAWAERSIGLFVQVVRKSADARVLQYAGLMGHTFAIIETAEDGSRLRGEASSIEEVLLMLRTGDRVYLRRGRKWAPVDVNACVKQSVSAPEAPKS